MELIARARGQCSLLHTKLKVQCMPKAIEKLLFLTLFLVASECHSEGLEYETLVDLNGDGIADIKYEYDKTGYYELIDRNFDGKVDESLRYSLDHYLLSGTSDDDFDGVFETRLVVENSLISSVLVDTNNNQIVDLVFRYKNSLVQTAEKYSIEYGTPVVARISYEFGYPVSHEKVEPSSMTELEFQHSVVNK